MLLDHFTVGPVNYLNQDIFEYSFEKFIRNEDERFYEFFPEYKTRWLLTNQQIYFMLIRDVFIETSRIFNKWFAL